MKISIEYEASWRNSFLDGNNNEPIPKNGRKFIGSMTSLKKTENFIYRDVTIDTVMGILNRLIGDQRKLYQSRNSEDYFFKDIENNVSFMDKPKAINHEMTFLRNISGSTDQNSYAGMIKTTDPIFTSNYAKEFWGILSLSLDDLCNFIISKDFSLSEIAIDPLSITSRLEELNKQKPKENCGLLSEAFLVLDQKFEKFNGINNKGLIKPISMYCSALYLQMERLSLCYDISSAKTKSGRLSGISNNGFTKKNFMGRYTTGGEKKVWGGPYVSEEFVKGEGKIKHFMTKASGSLDIIIDIESVKAKDIKQIIDNAGVSSFYLGKKGLAYVRNINTRKEL